jgi:5-methylcytosine-specific restriction endonuclease McrA
MKSFLNKRTVLILNKLWMPINTTSPKHSFALMYSNKAKGILVTNKTEIQALDWTEWCGLNLTEEDKSIKTVQAPIKIPNVIVLTFCDKIPKQAAKFTQKKLWERDKSICQYSGKLVTLSTGNIDHILPRSRGGKTTWENCVIAHKDINAIKADRTPEQAGLKLLKRPCAPKIMPISFYIKNKEQIKEWDLFLNKF